MNNLFLMPPPGSAPIIPRISADRPRPLTSAILLRGLKAHAEEQRYSSAHRRRFPDQAKEVLAGQEFVSPVSQGFCPHCGRTGKLGSQDDDQHDEAIGDYMMAKLLVKNWRKEANGKK